jgi:hypothetical protein
MLDCAWRARLCVVGAFHPSAKRGKFTIDPISRISHDAILKLHATCAAVITRETASSPSSAFSTMIPGNTRTDSPPSPGLAVIIPAYNRRELLLETLESVRVQTVAPRRVVIVDKGALDGSSRAAGE